MADDDTKSIDRLQSSESDASRTYRRKRCHLSTADSAKCSWTLMMLPLACAARRGGESSPPFPRLLVLAERRMAAGKDDDEDGGCMAGWRG